MWGRRSRGKATVLESALALVLMSVVAGAVGGLAIGIVTSPKSTATSSSSAAK
jgi:hypothetical protein